jgi:hypothetical protein
MASCRWPSPSSTGPCSLSTTSTTPARSPSYKSWCRSPSCTRCAPPGRWSLARWTLVRHARCDAPSSQGSGGEKHDGMRCGLAATAAQTRAALTGAASALARRSAAGGAARLLLVALCGVRGHGAAVPQRPDVQARCLQMDQPLLQGELRRRHRRLMTLPTPSQPAKPLTPQPRSSPLPPQRHPPLHHPAGGCRRVLGV